MLRYSRPIRMQTLKKNVELDKVFNYFESEFMPLLSKNDNLGQLANDVVRLDADSKKFICEMLEKADFNISDLYIKEEKGEVSEEAMEKFRKIAKNLTYLGTTGQEHIYRRIVLHPQDSFLYGKSF